MTESELARHKAFEEDAMSAARIDWIPRVQNGDCLAIAFLAMLEHQVARLDDLTPSSDPHNLIRRAMTSDDPEFLIELGEELVVGNPFFRDIKLAQECFRRALAYSEMMGSYAMGRFVAGVNKSAAIGFFGRSAELGHFPSKVICGVGFEKTKNPLVKALKTASFGLTQMNDVENALKSGDLTLKFWRYRDDFDHIKQLQHAMQSDRRRSFPWRQPISSKAFINLCKGEAAETLSYRQAKFGQETLRPPP